MEELGNDALAHVAYWARYQDWYPRGAHADIVFTDQLRLTQPGSRLLFARSGSYAFIIPIALSADEHPASFALVNGMWLVDGLQHAPTRQSLLDAATGHVQTAFLRGSGGARMRTEDDDSGWRMGFRRVLRGDAAVEARLSDDLYRHGTAAMPQVLSRLSAQWHDGEHDRLSEFLLVRETWPGEQRAVELLDTAARTGDDVTRHARRMGHVLAELHDAARGEVSPGASASLLLIEDVLDEAPLPASERAWLHAECQRFRHLQRRMRPAPTLPGLTLDSMLLADDAAGFFDLASDYRGAGLNGDDAGRLAFGMICIAERASGSSSAGWTLQAVTALAEGARMSSPAELVSLRVALLAEALSVLRSRPSLAVPRCIDAKTAHAAASRALEYLRENGSAVTQQSRLLA